ncbi:MAG: [FeFe] hydrogenase H-cluster radical SAM maturase HydG, partial [Defluviitaleaceae bacterium]|nr:[FeFe] hydrogenase H-cluster radical SAM maturase HydG [Defluviitaleaceae bacterium]
MRGQAIQEKFFIDDFYIHDLLRDAKKATNEDIEKILQKAERFEGLSHQDVAALLVVQEKKYIDRIFEIARKIKSHVYGERVVVFAPLYVSDYCVNQCEYCGFNCDSSFRRRKLSMAEVMQEVKVLEKMGHKRIALEAGEDQENCPIDYILECIKTIYSMKFENGEIRRVNVNIAATTVDEYKMLKAAQIGTYILFQETYHQETYERVHPKGPKSDYMYHSTAFDRAMEAGVDDVGAGVLFGLYDYKYDVLGLMLHNEHL